MSPLSSVQAMASPRVDGSTLSDSQLIALVTGGNRGIGLEIVRQLAERHPQWIIYMGSRSTEKGVAALAVLRSTTSLIGGSSDVSVAASQSYGNVRVLEFDVTSPQSTIAATATLTSAHGRLDLLLCNAGVMLRKPPSVAELVLQTNLYAVHDTLHDMNALLASSEQPLVVVVSSEVSPWVVHQLRGEVRRRVENVDHQTSWVELTECAADYVRFMHDPHSPSLQFTWPAPQSTVYSYGVSKALVDAFIRTYAAQHPEITVVCSCPGYCATDMTAGAVGVQKRSAADGAESVLWAVEHREEMVSGRSYQDGAELPVAQARRSRHRHASNKR